jgi:regulator of replication initiation timing
MVELASHEEFSKIETSLQNSVEETLRNIQGDWSENELYSIRNRLLQMVDNVLHKLRLGVDCSGLSDHIVNKNGELILYSGDSYNKLHEEEIENLEQKANQLAKELEECRRTVPGQIMENLKQQLESVRPNTDLKESETENNNLNNNATAVTNADHLKEKLSTACQKMPEIRAKIEEAVARTDRVIRAIEYETSKSGEDGNLEQLLQEGNSNKDSSSDDGENGDAGLSPAVKQAEISGHISVRKKWAKLMTFSSPMKFSLKDAR